MSPAMHRGTDPTHCRLLILLFLPQPLSPAALAIFSRIPLQSIAERGESNSEEKHWVIRAGLNLKQGLRISRVPV